MILCFSSPFLGHIFADMLPKISEHGHFIAWKVLSHRNAWQFDDAAFDSIHQGEIAHGPGKETALGITGPAQMLL